MPVQPPGTQSVAVLQPELNGGSTHDPPQQTAATPPARVHGVPFGVLAVQTHWPPVQAMLLAAQLVPHAPQLFAFD